MVSILGILLSVSPACKMEIPREYLTVLIFVHGYTGFPMWCSDKESACQCRRCKRHRFNPGVGKTPWSRKWQPTPVFLPEKFHGQRSLAGYSP